MSTYLESFRERNQDKLNLDEMDFKHIELSSLFEFSQTLNGSLELKAVLDSLLFVPMGRLLVTKGLVMLSDEDGGCKIATVKGLPNTLIGSHHPMPQFELKAQHIPSDLSYEVLPDIFETYKLRLLIPIQNKHQLSGIIALSGKMTQQPFTDSEIDFLASTGNIAAPAIENAQVFNKLNRVNLQLDKKIQELNTLFEIGNELNRLFEKDEILKKLSFSLMGQLFVNQFFVVLKESDTFSPVLIKGTIFNNEKVNDCLTQTVLKSEINQPLLISTEQEDNAPALRDTGVKVIVPMLVQEQVRGYIFIGTKLNKAEFSESDVAFLSTLANIAIISIENARLFQETLEKKRLEDELNIAKQIQKQLLPAVMPNILGYNVHGHNSPSKMVGGDYFDILPLSEEEYIFTIADVSGKGMPASLLMSNLQAGLNTVFNENYSLAQITGRLNNLIHKNTSIERYITFFIAKLNIKTHQFTYVNAGHNPPYLFRKDGSYEELTTGGIIIGMMADFAYETGTITIPEEATICMFTDGVTEAMAADDEPFDEWRLIDFLKEKTPANNSQQINEDLIRLLYDFAGDPTKDDDVTILTLKRQA